MPLRVGLCFSRPFKGNTPLDNITVKLPVYLRLLELCQQKGWQVFILTRRTYQGKGVFKGSWQFKKGKFWQRQEAVKINLVYDRAAGMIFPPARDKEMVVVNRRDFKQLCYDKHLTFKEIGQFMPKTVWIGKESNLAQASSQIKTAWVVLKPYNGLKGLGIFVGPKEKALSFKFSKKYRQYIAQEFVDTSGGMPGLAKGLHDLRVVVINGKVVWCHVRTPPVGSFKANVAQGGKIKEVEWGKVPEAVKKIVRELNGRFYEEFDNPIYSIDFGMGKDGPLIFELNDQVGFPLWEMKARERFLEAHIKNFSSKLKPPRPHVGDSSLEAALLRLRRRGSASALQPLS